MLVYWVLRLYKPRSIDFFNSITSFLLKIQSINKARNEIYIKYSQEKGKKEANLKGKSKIQQTIILLSRIQI
jgi:hypothetical protein